MSAVLKDVSVVVTAIDETVSLEETINIIMRENADHVLEILAVIAKRTTPASRASLEKMRKLFPDIIRVHEQTLPFVGGALREAYELVRGKYTVLIAADLETPPENVKDLIREIKTGTHDIIATTRWGKGGSFHGYHPLKLACNWVFQHFFSLLYGTRLTDLTYGYRIFRSEILKKIQWEELKHPFFLECLVKPLRLGYKVKEISVQWKPREEGVSQMTLSAYAGYFRIGFKTRFRKPSDLLKK